MSYQWPGNVRELINSVRRAVVLAEGPWITPADLGIERRSPARRLRTLAEARMVSERLAVDQALARSRRNISRAAQELGISRVTLHRMLERFRVGDEEIAQGTDSEPQD